MTNSFSDFSCFLLLFWHFWGGTNQVFCTCPSKRGFPHSSVGKESAYSAGDLGSIPGLGRSPEEGEGYPLQYSGLENSMDCITHGVAKSRTWLRDLCFHFQSSDSSTVSLMIRWGLCALGFPGSSVVKNLPTNGKGRFPGEGNSNPF